MWMEELSKEEVSVTLVNKYIPSNKMWTSHLV